jgi:hypothetical protein
LTPGPNFGCPGFVFWSQVQNENALYSEHYTLIYFWTDRKTNEQTNKQNKEQTNWQYRGDMELGARYDFY